MASKVIIVADSSETPVSGSTPVRSATGADPVTALNAVTSTGISAVIDLGVARANHTIQTLVTGAPTGVTCTLQGSLDGVTFINLAQSTNTSADALFATGKPFRYLRVNLTTLTGGTAPTVTAWVCSA